MTSQEHNTPSSEPSNDCFVIMPIADPEGYDKGHFGRVYEDIFKVACKKSGFNPVRADEVKQTNLIHLDILQKLIDSPMAICDLSSRNPNVLFELGLRQAFDKPTVLVQDIGTPKIFDIAPLRYTEYRKELKYREVLEDQDIIALAINATKEATSKGDGVNSIVSILSLSKPASLKQVEQSESSGLLQIIRAEMSEMRADFRRTINSIGRERDMRLHAPSNIYAKRSEEARMRLREAEHLLEAGAPKELILDLLVSSRKHLLRATDSDVPVKLRDEAMHLLSESDKIESRLMNRIEANDL
jgi:hypothetical protein